MPAPATRRTQPDCPVLSCLCSTGSAPFSPATLSCCIPRRVPTVFLVWLIVPGIVIGWRRGERLAAIQALMLLLAAIGIDALGVPRGLKSEYFIFTDPLIILAGVILLDRLCKLRFGKWTYGIGTSLLVLHLAIGQADPV